MQNLLPARAPGVQVSLIDHRHIRHRRMFDNRLAHRPLHRAEYRPFVHEPNLCLLRMYVDVHICRIDFDKYHREGYRPTGRSVW